MSENYLGITLSSMMSKFFEKIILKKWANFTCRPTSECQYGFKKNSSTTCCTFIVQEVVSFYNSHKSSVICTLLDCLKAFD